MPRSSTTVARHLISINQAAEYAGVSSKTIRRWIAAGLLAGHRAGPRLIRIDAAELDQMMRPIPTVDRAS